MIGIFDSGSGGLTVLRAIKEKAPNINIVYFGDLKHMPYGNRAKEELGTLTMNAISTLIQHGAKDIVSACNSVSESVLKTCNKMILKNDVRIIEMTKPTAQALCKSNMKVLILATSATVVSKAYQKAFREYNCKLKEIAVPDLAQAIEEGWISDCKKIISEIAPQIQTANPDIVLLGCTQFPLIKSVFEKMFASTVCDPASFVAEAVIGTYFNEGEGKLQFLLSQDSAIFRKRVKRMFAGITYEVTIV